MVEAGCLALKANSKLKFDPPNKNFAHPFVYNYIFVSYDIYCWLNVTSSKRQLHSGRKEIEDLIIAFTKVVYIC